MLRKRKKNADRIINDALTKSRKVMIEMEEIKKQASVYKMRFKMLIEAQLEMLQTEDWDQVTVEEEEEATN
ncbi:cell-division initiation protein [Bacillus sp. TS-2]|nr:cell-division initiation protein [Bacillus sp. TS-2]